MLATVAVVSFAIPAIGGVTAGQAAGLPGDGVKLTACTSTSLEGWFREIVVKRGLEAMGFEVTLPTTLSVPAYH